MTTRSELIAVYGPHVSDAEMIYMLDYWPEPHPRPTIVFPRPKHKPHWHIRGRRIWHEPSVQVLGRL